MTAGLELQALPIRNRLRVDFEPRDKRVLVLKFRRPGTADYVDIPSEQLHTETSSGGAGCAVDCDVGDWGLWGQCTGACHKGARTRSRAVSLLGMHGGRSCGAVEEEGKCEVSGCACEISEWSPWSECNCPGSYRERSREIIHPATAGATPCGPVIE